MTAGIATKNIGSIFMNDAAVDEIGIRGTPGGGNLSYTNGQTFRWFGSGIMDKPIGDFRASEHFSLLGFDSIQTLTDRPYFGGVHVSIYHRVIPEPEEYALVFGLFALGFIFFRQFQKKTKKGGGSYGRL